ncbi:MAG: hypothetical protein Q9168_008436 [Polycauliona sp. 1 TL-2023]
MRPHRTNPSPSNTIPNSLPEPRGIVRADSLGGLKVHANGRTSGLQTGTILPTMVIVKMPGRISHSSSWQVKGNFGIGGDSGAWVIDTATGGVCAHVLAWSQRSGSTYVAPMEVMFEDMARVLGAEVELPVPLLVERGDGDEVEGQSRDGLDAIEVPTRGLALSDVDDDEMEDDDDSSSRILQAQPQPQRCQTRSQPQPQPQPQQLPSPSPSPTPSPSPSPHQYTSPPIPSSTPTSPPPLPSAPRSSPTTITPTSIPPLKPHYQLESKRQSKSGSEMLIEKGEEQFRVGCQRMSVS